MKKEHETNEERQNKRKRFCKLGFWCRVRTRSPKTKKPIHLFRQFSLISCSLFILLTAGACKSGSNRSTAQPAIAAQPAPTRPPVKRLIKKAGWKIPGLAVAKEIYSPRVVPAASNERVKVYSTWYRPRTGDAGPVSLNDFLSDQERAELGITPTRLHVKGIVKYDFGDRPFCYVIKYRATYTIEGLHYYDEDGDNRFELVETGTASSEYIPRIPSWTQR
jgi:hypothetical protein